MSFWKCSGFEMKIPLLCAKWVWVQLRILNSTVLSQSLMRRKNKLRAPHKITNCYYSFDISNEVIRTKNWRTWANSKSKIKVWEFEPAKLNQKIGAERRSNFNAWDGAFGLENKSGDCTRSWIVRQKEPPQFHVTHVSPARSVHCSVP